LSSQIERLAAYAATLGNWFAALIIMLLMAYIAWSYARRRRFLDPGTTGNNQSGI